MIHTLTFSSDEKLLLHLVAVGVPEVSPSQGSATARVVDDLLDDSLDVTMPATMIISICCRSKIMIKKKSPLGEVDSSESRLALPVLRVRHEDRSRALPLGSDDTTHL